MITVIMTIEPCIKTEDFERALAINVQRVINHRQAVIIVADIQNSARHAEIVQRYSRGVAAYLGVPRVHGVNMSAFARNMAAAAVRDNRILFIDADCSLREAALRYHDRQTADICVGALVSRKWVESRNLRGQELYLKGDPRESIAPISARQLDIYAYGYTRVGSKCAPKEFAWVENLSISADVFCNIGGFWEYAAPGELGYDIAHRVDKVYCIKPGIHFSAAVDFPRGHVRRPNSKQRCNYEIAFSKYLSDLPPEKKSVQGAHVSTFLPVHSSDQAQWPKQLLELKAAFPDWNRYVVDVRWAFPKPENNALDFVGLGAKDLDAIVGKVSRGIELTAAGNIRVPTVLGGFGGGLSAEEQANLLRGGWIENPLSSLDDFDDDDDEDFDEDETDWDAFDDEDWGDGGDDSLDYDDYDDDEDN